MLLGRELDFAHKPGSVLIRALDIDAYVLLSWKGIDVLRVCVSEVDNLMLRDEFLEEEQKEPFPVLHAERSLEPIVQQDAGVSPDDGFFRHDERISDPPEGMAGP